VNRIPLPLLLIVVLLAAGCGGSSAVAPDYDIAYVTSRDGDYALYGVRDDGSGQGRLTRDDGGNGSSPAELFFQVDPTWSPDGSRIAFSSRRDGHSHIYVMRADGSGTKRLTSRAHEDTGPAWSPDGRRIAFVRDGRLHVVSATGGRPRPVGLVGGEERDPAWSPDGRWLAFVRREPGFTSREIWRIRPDGSDPQRLTRLNVGSYGPAWSNDSRRIVFSSNAEDGRYQLYVIGAGGKGLRRLTFQPGEYFDPSWSPDGKRLVFERDGIVYVRNANGAEIRITKGPNDGTPAWRPRQEASGS
jgi:TolB protein